MDDRNFSNIFRKATGSFFCPACGSKYQGTEIESIERHEAGYLVSVSCQNCHLKLTMQVVTKGFAGFEKEATEPNESSITVDEVIEFHKVVREFDGNFRRVFTARIDQNHLFW